MPGISNSVDRFNGVVASLAIKAPCAAVAITNITLSGAQTVNGVAVTTGDRVLVTAQTSSVNNGIYDVKSAAWDRAADFDGNRDVAQGTLVVVYGGATVGATYQVTSANPIVIGSSALTFQLKASPDITYPQTAAEIAASVVPFDLSKFPSPIRDMSRYVSDNTGATDVSAEVDDAIKVNKHELIVPEGIYLLNSILTPIDFAEFHMIGAGGIVKRSEFRCSALAGAIIQIKQRSPKIQGIAFTSTAARLAAVTSTGIGILFSDDDDPAANIISRQHLEDVLVEHQPTDGIHSSNGCELSGYSNVTVQDCLRHAYVWDDGTTRGLANNVTPPFHWTAENVRAIGCGGHAYVIGHPSQSLIPNDFQATNLQALGCAWDTTKRISALHYLVVHYSRGGGLDIPDIEDQQFGDAVTSSTGMARDVLGAPGAGIIFGTGRTTVENPYFSSLVKSVEMDAPGVKVINPTVFQGAYGLDQAIAFNSGSGAIGSRVELQTAIVAATEYVRTQSEEFTYALDGQEHRGLPTTLGDFELDADGSTILTIASGNIPQLSGDYRTLAAETGTADSAGLITFNGARDGVVVTLQADAGDTITLTSGTATSGANKGLQLKEPNRILVGDNGDTIMLKYNKAADVFFEIDYRVAGLTEDTATNIIDVAAAINTTGKYEGKKIYDTTNLRMLRAVGATAGADWEVVDGSLQITPV